MKAYTLLIISILLMSCSPNTKNEEFPFDIPKGEQAQKTTYFFVRHAEKDTTDAKNKDPQLTEKGLRRANFLAQFFEDKSLEMFYSTDFTRTLQTLIPTVHHYKGEIKSYSGKTDSLFNS